MKSPLVFAIAVMALSLLGAPKNIILFIGDGTSTPQRMTAEEFSRKSGRGPLVMNNLPYQATTRTCSANSLITDSAAAATAIACGTKTRNGAIGVDASTNRLISVAEVAKARGKKVGIVTTVTINHATPAGFYGHRKSRGEGYGLGLDLVASGFDYFAGGGASGNNDTNYPGYRGGIYEIAAKSGYKFIKQDYAAFKALKRGKDKVWYVATPEVMPFAIDEKEWKDVPTLAELTAKGIELLENERGFFMMVEGGKVDYAGHANDAGTNLRDLLALDDAVKVALEYQKSHPDTLVVTTGDHETGGMSMGFAGTGSAFKMDKLVGQRCSVGSVGGHIKRNKITNFAALKPFIEENFRFDFTKADWKELEAAFNADVEATKRGVKENEAYDAVKVSKFPAVLKQMVSHKCGIGWSSGSHTALPVLTTAIGPSADKFHGFIDNTDISKLLKAMIQ